MNYREQFYEGDIDGKTLLDVIDEKEAEAQALREQNTKFQHMLADVVAKHFAENIKRSTAQKSMDVYLSEGIRLLEEEIAALRARVVVDEHAEFERLFSVYKMKRHHHGTGGYTDFMTHCVFEAFQAGVRLNGKAVSEELLRDLLKSAQKLSDRASNFMVSGVEFIEIGDNNSAVMELEVTLEALRALLDEGKEDGHEADQGAAG